VFNQCLLREAPQEYWS